MRIFVDMDGTIAKWNNVAFEQLYEEGDYRNLEPDNAILEEIKGLIATGFDVYILSAYLTDIIDEETGKLLTKSYALEDKKEWLKEYLPELKEENALFVPFGTNKAEYLRDNYSPVKQDDYLIDDYTQNLNEWSEYGGTGIKYLNGINHTKGTWKGANISQSNTNLVQKISELRDFCKNIKKLYNVEFTDIWDIYNFVGCLTDVEENIVGNFYGYKFNNIQEFIDKDILTYCGYTLVDEYRADFYLDDCIVTVCLSDGEPSVPDIEMQDNYGTICNISYDDAISIRAFLEKAHNKDYDIRDINGVMNKIIEEKIEYNNEQTEPDICDD